ncbi:MAG: undecaprenyldiphospho-muramoylpentapeptide beta-N-acetylglucosaminyltransferase [Syntrophorhabdaceae bacterium]|nr:undecaprenyldiphospho-muramoylpentapeptide beta-N-acetylglucosaminyltransferase [Syntrophorhabdales bacterium]MBP9560428.1 undecaprenyldiphospho-muramoylpentapeptide beta-N-acetylglucosaminyltransferase [Syntrophorhabdaceae bacterium]
MKLFIAAGGTGGHVFPGISVADRFTAMSPENEVVFIGTKIGLESKAVPQAGYRILYVDARQFSGRNIVYKLVTVAGLVKGIHDCLSFIKKENPHAILGMGGFASVPMVIAGFIHGTPIFLHEQNVQPGLANKILAKYARTIFISFEDTRHYLGRSRVVLTGNPIRNSVKKRDRDIIDEQYFGIFVFGGSRGARSINQSVVDMLRYLKEDRDRVIIFHQTGAEDYEGVKDIYENSGIRHEVFPFTDNMAYYYNNSHVVISRAGASTIFELAYFERPAILIPYPFSAGQHQWKNALQVERIGGGYIIENSEATGERLFGVIKRLIDEPELGKKMGENMGRLYIDDAEGLIVKGIIDGIS